MEDILNKETVKLRNRYRKVDVQKRLEQLRNSKKLYNKIDKNIDNQ